MKKCFIMVLSLTVIFLVACKGKKLIDKQELASQEWVLSEFKNGDTLQKLPAEKLTIFFTDTNTVYGMAGCNRFMGRYELSKEKGFVMDPGGMTMMACPDMEVEGRVMKALNEVKSFGKLAGGGIGLYDADNTLVMVLVKK